MWSYTMHIYSSDQPYSYLHAPFAPQLQAFVVILIRFGFYNVYQQGGTQICCNKVASMPCLVHQKMCACASIVCMLSKCVHVNFLAQTCARMHLHIHSGECLQDMVPALFKDFDPSRVPAHTYTHTHTQTHTHTHTHFRTHTKKRTHTHTHTHTHTRAHTHTHTHTHTLTHTLTHTHTHARTHTRTHTNTHTHAHTHTHTGKC